MNVAVIGLGSMGKRRIRLLSQYIKTQKQDESQWKLYGVDFNEERCKECSGLFGIKTYHSLKDVLKNDFVDCAVISTSPHTHSSIIKECLENHLHVFTEINLIADGYGENISLARDVKKVLFLSSTFMYRKEIEYIKKKVQDSHFRGMYTYHIGQYLPEWHPWENYNNFFVGRKDTNGCREIFAIELPWLVDAFGKIKSVHSFHKKVSELKIDYDDSYQVQIEHESGIVGNLVVDIVTPCAGRNLEIWEEGFYIGWKGTPDTLIEYNRESKRLESVILYDTVEYNDGYQKFVVENAYYEELVNFIESIRKHQKPRHTFEEDAEVLSWIDEIEK